jgi:hypothetical protein
MYREPAPRKETAPRELVYAPLERQGPRPGAAALQIFAFPLIVGVIASVVLTPTAGLVGIALTAAFMIWSFKRPSDAGLLLRIDGGELVVSARASAMTTTRMRLDDLADVVLETKTIQPLMDGTSAIPAMRFIEGRVGGDVDTARIALVGCEGDSVLLGATYLAHMEALEWFGKIRVFLRQHGWVPASEQGAEP